MYLVSAQHIQVSMRKKRQSATQAGLESDFTHSMSQLLDIGHADWECRTRIPEDQQFLIDQRGPRQMSMTTEDVVYRHAAAKYQKHKQEEEPRQLRHKEESTLTAAAVVLILPVKPQRHMNRIAGQTAQFQNIHYVSLVSHSPSVDH